MKLLDNILSRFGYSPIRAGTPGAGDDYWYQPLGITSAAGMRVTTAQSMRLAAVYACVRVLSYTLASLPLKMYQRRADGGKEEAVNHPLQELLHDQPNEWMTAFQFRQLLWSHIELRGNFYARIVPGLRGAVDQLIPLHPDLVTVEQLKSGAIQYRVRHSDGRPDERLLKEEVFHVMGLSLNGVEGISTISAWAEVIGLGLGLQDFAGRFIANDATPGGVIEIAKTLDDPARKRFKKEWKEAHAGANRHGTAVLEAGMKYIALAVTNKDAQFIESRKMSRTEIASLFGVPLHKIGDLEKASFSNIEEQNIDFVVDAILPRCILLEQTIRRDLIVVTGRFFAQHNIDGLLRGKITDRYAAYALGIINGFLTRNEVRKLENLNPIDGLDEPVMQLNMAPANGPGAQRDTRAAILELSAAQSISRKEVAAIRRANERSSGDALASFLDEYYSEMPQRLITKLSLSPENAQQYASARRARLVEASRREQVTEVLKEWEQENGAALAALALE